MEDERNKPELELEELQKKLKISRNPVDKSIIQDQIADINKKLAELDSDTVEKVVKTSKEAAARIDHKEGDSKRSLITNTGDTFIAQI